MFLLGFALRVDAIQLHSVLHLVESYASLFVSVLFPFICSSILLPAIKSYFIMSQRDPTCLLLGVICSSELIPALHQTIIINFVHFIIFKATGIWEPVA